ARLPPMAPGARGGAAAGPVIALGALDLPAEAPGALGPVEAGRVDAAGHAAGLVCDHLAPHIVRQGVAGVPLAERCREAEDIAGGAVVPAPGDRQLSPIVAVVALVRAALAGRV